MPTPTPLSRNASTKFRVGTLHYNGVDFPPGRKMRTEYTPVMDDSGRITKYIKGKVQVSCVLFPGAIDAPVANVLPYRQATSVDATGIPASDVTTDQELTTLYSKLLEPCQHLKIEDQGMGTIELNDTTGTKIDVNNGPKPTLVKWTPYTNKAALVEWECEFCFTACSYQRGGTTVGGSVCQWPFEVEISINEKALSTVTITGRVEIAMNRVPNTTLPQAGGSKPYDMLTIEQMIISVYPRLVGFKRTKEIFKMSNDRKYVSFTIEDVELDTYETYGEGVSSADVTVRTSGSLKDGGFSKWATTLEGSIELYPGYDKSWAVKEAARLFNRYCYSVCTKGTYSRKVDTSGWTGNLFGTSSDTSYAILRTINYTDHVFERRMDFSYGWELFVRPQQLFLATGMFLPIENNETDRKKTWRTWMASGNWLDSGGYEQLTFTQERDLVVSLCDWNGPVPEGVPFYNFPKPEKPKKDKDTDKKTVKDNQEQFKLSTKDAFYSVFKNVNIIGQLGMGIPHIPLMSFPTLRENADNYNDMYKPGATKIPKSTGTTSSSTPETKALIHKYGPTTTTVTSVGYAERLGSAPQIMGVDSMDGKIAVPIGSAQFAQSMLGYGIDMLNGVKYSVHGLSWMKQYIIVGEAGEINLKTTGHQAAHSP